MVRTAYRSESAYHYDDRRFSSPQGRAFDHLEKEQLVGALRRLRRPARVVEVGSGTGRFLQLVLAEDEHTVWGIDPSWAMLAVTKDKTVDRGCLRLAQSEGASLPFLDGTFDFVYSIRVLNQVASVRYALEMIEEMVRVSRHWVLLEFVNRSRLIRRSVQGVQLTVGDVRQTLAPYPNVHIVSVAGILFLSQTVLNLIPHLCLGTYLRVDRKLSGWFPSLCGRVYVTLEKIPDTTDTCRGSIRGGAA